MRKSWYTMFCASAVLMYSRKSECLTSEQYHTYIEEIQISPVKPTTAICVERKKFKCKMLLQMI